MTTAKTYGELLREARQDAGRTLEWVAEKLSITASYVSDMEHDRRAPWGPQRTMDVAVALGVEWRPLMDARARYYKESTLPLGVSGPRDTIALALAHRWRTLTDEQVLRIASALEGA
jgi:transcriptional regulator with XRE-family HTH domain